MSLKDLLKTAKRQTVLLGKIDRYLMGRSAKSNAFKEERGGYDTAYHPSGLSLDSCPRAVTYNLLRTNKTNNKPNAKLQRIFDTGHGVGLNIQGYLYDMGVLLGEWECVQCGYEWEDMENPSPRKCPNCGKDFKGYIAGEGRWHDLIYKEVTVRGVSPSGKRKVLGHADGCFYNGDTLTLLETKSIKARDKMTRGDTITFEDLNQPLENHLVQLNMYLQFNSYGITEGVFLYWNKNNQELKEFPIKKMDIYINPILELMDIVDEHIENQQLPIRKCAQKGEQKWCPYIDTCFSTKNFDEVDARGGKLGTE